MNPSIGRRDLLAAGIASVLPSSGRAQTRASLSEVLDDLMRKHRVPGVSAAVIRDNEIAERLALGVAEAGKPAPVGPDTLFQAASISKVVAGQIILILADRGRLALDAPVNELLRSWTLRNGFAQPVTPRLLLSHRGGTTVSGFPGYAAGAPLPSLRQILDGTPPANTPAVKVEWLPGGAFRYSGGGTMVLQQIAMDVAGASFNTLASTLVLTPAAMSRSSFAQPLPASASDASAAHDLDGRPLPGRCHVYPELAAAGLWTTSGDLARLALAISASWRDGGLLTRATARSMATPVGDGPTGLGIFVRQRKGRAPLLYHYGVNAGFRSVLVFAADGSFGLALMTNGEGGRPLIPAFANAVFGAYGQGDFPPLG